MTSDIGFETVSKRFSKHPTHLRAIRDLADWLAFFKVNQPEAGWLIGMSRPNGHTGRAYSRSAVNNWIAGRAVMTDETREAIVAATNKLLQARGDRHSVEIVFRRSGWRVKVMRPCKCGRIFQPEDRFDVCRRCQRASDKQK